MRGKVLLAQVRDNLKTHTATTVTGLLTTTFSLVILGTFFLFYQNLVDLTHRFFQQGHYSVFLAQNHPEADRQAVQAALERLPQVGEINLVSPEEAREELLQSFLEARPILEQLETKRLPWVIDFSLNRATALTDEEQQALEQLPSVTGVFTGKETKDQVFSFFGLTSFVGWVLVGLLLFTVLLVIKNTIQLAVRIRIKEIEVLSLLGATKSFIQAPFWVEGGLLGGFSALLALGLVYPIYRFLVAGIGMIPALSFVAQEVCYFGFFQSVFFVLALTGIGVLSAGWAARQTLRALDR